MATRMQQRRGTEAQWTTANPVLAAGEIGFETDTNQFKMGDGVNTWSDLTYFIDATTLSGSLDDYIPLASAGVADGVATLDENGFVPASQLDIDVAADINAAIDGLIDGAPGVLDTLNELAAALGDDADFITTINTSIGLKQDKVTGVTDTEIGYLDGVTSAIQGQIDAKQDKVSGVTDTEIGYLDGVTSAIQTQIDTKQDKVSGVTDTEIGYLDGVTSSIQPQIDSKISLSQAISDKSSNYTLQSTDSGKLITNSSAITITVEGLSAGQQVDFLQTGSDQITFVAGSGITLNSKDSKLSTSAQGSPVSVKCISSTVYWLVGDLA